MRDDRDLDDGDGFIHLYFEPLFHDPASNASPIRQRRQIGIAKAR